MKSYIFDQLPDGTPVTAYEFGAGNLCATVLDYGGILQKLLWKGTDMIGGYDKLEGYLVSDGYQGALVGRYANRIKGGAFTLNGKTYQLAKNEKGKTHIHGGITGYDKRMWTAVPLTEGEKESLVLTLSSPDGEEGYPGNVDIKVTYTVDGDALAIHYEATSDKDTPFNMTNHSYFNMNGIGGGAIYDQTLQVFADQMSAVDADLIPYETISVAGTPFDFRQPALLSQSRMECDDPQMQVGSGLDHNFFISADAETCTYAGTSLKKAAIFSGKLASMTLYTDTPCVQFYAGNFMDGPYPFKGGQVREKRHALCLETQYAPDSPNHGDAILKAGTKYDHTALFTFA